MASKQRNGLSNSANKIIIEWRGELKGNTRLRSSELAKWESYGVIRLVVRVKAKSWWGYTVIEQ